MGLSLSVSSDNFYEFYPVLIYKKQIYDTIAVIVTSIAAYVSFKKLFFNGNSIDN